MAPRAGAPALVLTDEDSNRLLTFPNPESLDVPHLYASHADYLRIRAFPFGDEVREFLKGHKTVFVVEQNRDAQMKSLLLLEAGAVGERLVSILHYDGMPIPGECVIQGIVRHIEAEAAA